jgi:hypothetical protein
MRTKPSSVDYSTLLVYDQVNLIAITSIAIQSESTPYLGRFNSTVASGGVVNRMYEIAANNSTSSYLGFSAEL